MQQSASVAFVGFGEVNTPREIIEKKCRAAADMIKAEGVDVRTVTSVADDPGGSQAARAVAELKNIDFDCLVICVAGWIPSWAVMRVIDPFKHKPMLLWGLSGWREDDRFITTADQAGTTALRHPMREMGFKFKYVVNHMGEPVPLNELISFIHASRAMRQLRYSRIGMAGYRDMRLYATGYDGISLKACVGIEIEHFDLLELEQYMKEMDDSALANPIAVMRKNWQFLREPKPETLAATARLFLALQRKIREGKFDGLSYADVDGVKKLLKFAPAGALTLLHDQMTICTIPENDSLGAVTQQMCHSLTGQVGAYLEFYEFTRHGALMGVPDYVPSEIVDGRVTILPNSFGEFGEGLLNVSRLKTGMVTLARLGYSKGRYFLHMISGTAKSPRKWEEAGWAPPAPQLPSLEIDFAGDTATFIQNVLGQHYILAHGDQRSLYRDLCLLLGIELLGENL